jgi:hypothetical protein
MVTEKSDCAEIYFQSNYQGLSIKLGENEQITDLTYVESNYGQTTNNSFISVKLMPHCNLLMSDGKFMKGKRASLQSNVSSFDKSEFNLKSALCTCPEVSKKI